MDCVAISVNNFFFLLVNNKFFFTISLVDNSDACVEMTRPVLVLFPICQQPPNCSRIVLNGTIMAVRMAKQLFCAELVTLVSCSDSGAVFLIVLNALSDFRAIVAFSDSAFISSCFRKQLNFLKTFLLNLKKNNLKCQA